MGEEHNTQAQQQATQPEAIDYSKIEAMISKGTQQKESAILKSYFEQQGMTDEEVFAICPKAKKDWRAVFDLKRAFEMRKGVGMPNPKLIAAQIANLRNLLK